MYKLNQMVQYQPPVHETFAALADPTRIGFIERLGRADATISQLAAQADITLAGAKKHVQVLESVGLVSTRKEGRTRVCTLGHPNACSMLLGACRRVARSLGYRRLVSYTLKSEPGTSLRAAGWSETAAVRGRSWNCPSRPRQSGTTIEKRRWEVPLGRAGSSLREVV